MDSSLHIEKRDLFYPSFDDLVQVLQNGLKQNFEDVFVDVVDCPDLTKEPFGLASKGLGGSPVLLDVGGPPYLLPIPKKEKIYDLKQIVSTIGINPCLVLGAGAGPWISIGTNCEMMANAYFNPDVIENKTYIAKMEENGKHFCLSGLPSSETRFALLANLFFSEGKPCKVLRIKCKRRSGPENYISAIREVLEKNFKEKPVGLGGVFLTKSGKAKHHIMPDFSKEPLNSDEALNKWLKFFEFSAPIVSVGTLISSQIEDLDLRVQHFHSFSKHGEGGHYHYDVTPTEIDYEGFFNIAEKIYRIDKPLNTHMFGRD